MKTKELKIEDYLNGLIDIADRIEENTKEGKLNKANEWYSYLQGYIKALKVLSK
jgi:hypothetical protein